VSITRDSKSNNWTATTLWFGGHGQSFSRPWDSIYTISEEDIAEADTSTVLPERKAGQQHPFVYIGWAKHSNFDSPLQGSVLNRNTNSLSQLFCDAIRYQSVWGFVEKRNFILAGLSTAASQAIDSADWGRAKGTPTKISLCNINGKDSCSITTELRPNNPIYAHLENLTIVQFSYRYPRLGFIREIVFKSYPLFLGITILMDNDIFRVIIICLLTLLPYVEYSSSAGLANRYPAYHFTLNMMLWVSYVLGFFAIVMDDNIYRAIVLTFLPAYRYAEDLGILRLRAPGLDDFVRKIMGLVSYFVLPVIIISTRDIMIIIPSAYALGAILYFKISRAGRLSNTYDALDIVEEVFFFMFYLGFFYRLISRDDSVIRIIDVCLFTTTLFRYNLPTFPPNQDVAPIRSNHEGNQGHGDGDGEENGIDGHASAAQIVAHAQKATDKTQGYKHKGEVCDAAHVLTLSPCPLTLFC
jgi:hypothetical protein